MSQKQGGGKKKRTSKRSKGINGGGGKHRMTDLELFLMGKGPHQRSLEKLQVAGRKG